MEKVEQCPHKWSQKARTPRGHILDATCVLCGILKKDVFPATTFEGFIRRWIAGKLTEKIGKRTLMQTKCGNYQATDTKLSYYGKGRKVPIGEDILAIKIPDGRLIGNASKLTRCGSYRRSAESPAQRVMQELEISLIPFNVFQEANLDLRTAKVIEQGATEELTVPKMEWNSRRGEFGFAEIWHTMEKKEMPVQSEDNVIKNLEKCKFYSDGKYVEGWHYEKLIKANLEQRHFIGAMVIEVGKKYYLFDVDRHELTFWRFNAFLSELPKPVKTIAEAYDSLIPISVRKAQKQGKEVRRQGEWFFIPSELPKPVTASKADHKIGEKQPEPKEFDLHYYLEDLDIIEKDIKNKIEQIKPKYRESHINRIKDFRMAMKRYINAMRRLARENPDKYARRGELQAKTNRPNYVTKYLSLPEGQFVSGEVTHSGREHEPLKLKGWYIAVPNTAIGSWTIVGAID